MHARSLRANPPPNTHTLSLSMFALSIVPSMCSEQTGVVRVLRDADEVYIHHYVYIVSTASPSPTHSHRGGKKTGKATDNVGVKNPASSCMHTSKALIYTDNV